MKILLDENLPRKLQKLFDDAHEVRTVRDMGWLGKKNGELLGLLTLGGFDIFITIDKNLRFQQNLSKFNVSIFLLMAYNNRYDYLIPFVQQVIKSIDSQSFELFNLIENNRENEQS